VLPQPKRSVVPAAGTGTGDGDGVAAGVTAGGGGEGDGDGEAVVGAGEVAGAMAPAGTMVSAPMVGLSARALNVRTRALAVTVVANDVV
jgi:hypothetical protein